MTFDLDKFLDQLAGWFVARAAALTPAVTLEYASTPRSLWIHSANEEVGCASVYSVLASNGGVTGQAGDSRIALQVMTYAGDPQAALVRGGVFHGVLFDESTNRPALRVTLDDFRILGFLNRRAPAVVGRDDKDRWFVASNVDVIVVPD